MTDDTGRAYWDRQARNYDRAMLLGGPMPAMVERPANAGCGRGT